LRRWSDDNQRPDDVDDAHGVRVIAGKARRAGNYDVVFSGDDALDLPEDPAARAHALKVARETGNYPCKQGVSPWIFTMQRLAPEVFDEWRSMMDEHGNRMGGTPMGASLLVRLALVGVRNIEGVSVRRVRGRFETSELAAADVLTAIPDAARDAVISEFADVIIGRERDLTPL
jgi:hypothetical protein